MVKYDHKKDVGKYESVYTRFLEVRQIVQVLHKHFAQGPPYPP